MTEVHPVDSRRAWKEFLELPYRLYRDSPYWVPPLRIQQKRIHDDRHPFYAQAEVRRFLALQSSRTVGRVAAIIDHNSNRFRNEQAGFFGFLETVDQEEVAGALLDAAARWLRERGMRVMRGPMNPSTNYECGLLVEGFDSGPCLMMPYNPPYYPPLVEQAGLRKLKDLYAYFTTATEIDVGKVERVANRALAGNNVRIRSARLDDFDAEIERFFQLYNSAWSRNWGFTPITREQVNFLARELKPLLDPDLALLAEIGDRVVGCALAVADINQALRHARGRLFPLGALKILYYKRRIRRMRVLILGVIEEYSASGVAAALYAALFRNGLKAGYREGEFSWVLEDNVLMNRSLEAMGARRYKTYRIYEGELM